MSSGNTRILISDFNFNGSCSKLDVYNQLSVCVYKSTNLSVCFNKF